MDRADGSEVAHAAGAARPGGKGRCRVEAGADPSRLCREEEDQRDQDGEQHEPGKRGHSRNPPRPPGRRETAPYGRPTNTRFVRFLPKPGGRGTTGADGAGRLRIALTEPPRGRFVGEAGSERRLAAALRAPRGAKSACAALAVGGAELAVGWTELAVAGAKLAVGWTYLAVGWTYLAVGGAELAVGRTELELAGDVRPTHAALASASPNCALTCAELVFACPERALRCSEVASAGACVARAGAYVAAHAFADCASTSARATLAGALVAASALAGRASTCAGAALAGAYVVALAFTGRTHAAAALAGPGLALADSGLGLPVGRLSLAAGRLPLATGGLAVGTCRLALGLYGRF